MDNNDSTEKPANERDPAPAPQPPLSAQGWLELKVGAFVVGLIGIGIAVVLLFASKHNLFQPEVLLRAVFTEVQGLKEGAPVLLSGVQVGSVSRIDFVTSAERPFVTVDLRISRRRFHHIRTDSVAHIDTQGLLGDKIIEISMGSSAQPQLAEGAMVQTVPPADFAKLMAQAGDILTQIKRVADRMADIVNEMADKKTVDDVKASIASLRNLMQATEKGEGLAHAIFYDRRTAGYFRELAGHLNLLVSHVDEGVKHIDQVLGATDENGKQLINHLSLAARNIGQVAADVRQSKIVPHLEVVSGDLAELSSYVKSGKGTLGSIVMDPTIYEQLVTVLGGVARSRILRALVRYALRKDDDTLTKVVNEREAEKRKAPALEPRKK